MKLKKRVQLTSFSTAGFDIDYWSAIWVIKYADGVPVWWCRASMSSIMTFNNDIAAGILMMMQPLFESLLVSYCQATLSFDF